MKLETLCLHAGQEVESTTKSRAVPVYRTSSYLFDNTEHAADLFALKEMGNIYTRLMNPTQDVLEKRVAAMEGGAAALALASGTSAIFYSIINICQAGDEIVSAANLYGGTYTMFNNILPQLGIQVRFVDPHDPGNFEKAITPRTKLLFCETIGNPALDVVDLEGVAQIAHSEGVPLVVDSTFTTPYLLKPLEHGADIVVHSLTKWLGGHGTGIGGIVVDSGKFDWTTGKFPLLSEPDESYHGIRYAFDLGDLCPVAYILRMRLVPLRNLGACISPDNAWIFLQGIETLPLRMERHSENALAVARHLKEHPLVEWVRYPGLEDDPAHAGGEQVPEQRVRGHGGLRDQGRQGGRGKVHRQPGALLSSGECGRRQEPGHSSGYDHPLSARRGTAAGRGHHARARKAFDRTRTHRRYPCGHGSSPGEIGSRLRLPLEERTRA